MIIRNFMSATLVAAAAIAFTELHAVAQDAVSVKGAGIAGFDSAFQIDQDPDVDGSKFGFNFVIGADGTVEGDCHYFDDGQHGLRRTGSAGHACASNESIL